MPHTPKLDVVTLGESMVLLLAEQPGPMREATTFRRFIAGAESNLAIGLSRLGQSAGWFSRVGDDEFGRAIVFRIRGEGVDTSHVVVDASALDWVAWDPPPRNAIRVLTPHPGEVARLLRSTSQQVQANRPEALQSLSRRFGNTWVVLKGHQTLIGRSSGEIYVNSSGNPHLAQGGSGDLLSGYLAGLLTQPALQVDVLKTIRYAVWQHGAAADKLHTTRRNWTVEDLSDELGMVSAEMVSS